MVPSHVRVIIIIIIIIISSLLRKEVCKLVDEWTS